MVKKVSVLRDTGCSTVVVRKDLVLDNQMTGKVQRCILIDGTVRDAPVARIWISSPYYTGSVDALCMSEPVYDIILGNIPCVREPSEPKEDWCSGIENTKNIADSGSSVKEMSNQSVDTESCMIKCTGKMEEKNSDTHMGSRQKKDEDTQYHIESQKGECAIKVKQNVERYVSEELKSDTNLEQGQAVQTRAQKVQESKRLSTLNVIDSLNVNKDEFKGEQVRCETLKWVREKAKTSEKKMSHGTVSWFKENKGLLYRYVEDKLDKSGKAKKQLVVPKVFRNTVLKLAHESILGGHLGMKKTSDKIRLQFFWPGLQEDVKLHCLSCDICQKTFPRGKVSPVPLEKMPLIETPFERVAVDLVGPIQPVTDRKNRYILTLVDYATRYPEAVPLPRIEAERVAEALFNMFTRLGFPSEILTDMGSQFTSDVMKEVSRLLSIKMLTTTPYHPCCNGLVEKFNGTLKSMLRKICAENPKDWDRFIPALLFAYRETPQESLGFSPFELLYGRTVRGPMSILKDLWTDDVPEPEVRTTYQYVLDLKDRLETVSEIARKHLEQSSSRYKHYYDRKTRDRHFEVNDQVLVLLPTDGNKLLMQWKGPYRVTEKMGRCDYKLDMEGKVKPFHANLLKKYISRDSICGAGLEEVDETDSKTKGLIDIVCIGVVEDEPDVCEDMEDACHNCKDEGIVTLPDIKGKETVADVKISKDLSKQQENQVKELLEEFKDVLTDIPGETNLIEHKINLTSDQPIRTKQYPLPFAMSQTVKEETKKMLEMGIVEPSSSPYLSPVVLVKKSDQTVRFCIDFRNLNKITVYDAEPIPNPEEIFSKLATSNYFTKIDLSKGYWQIRLTEDSKEKTAFSTPYGLFQFRKLPFGLVTAPANFSRMMRLLLKGLKDIDNFIDDILEHTETWDDHIRMLRVLLQRLRDCCLTARPSKCEIGFSSIEFLGHCVGNGKLMMSEEKVKAIVEAPRPETKKQVKSFLGMIGFYRKFVPNFAEIALPLTELTKKGSPNRVPWEDVHQRSFESLKSYMVSSPILRLPELQKVFILRTDASNTGIGAVLLQESNGVVFPVAYASKKLLPRETRYSVIERECLALVWGIRKFQMYLYGKEFQVETDHYPLIYMQSAKLTNSRVMRWVLSLQPYKFQLKAIKGVHNIGADYLSRNEK